MQILRGHMFLILRFFAFCMHCSHNKTPLKLPAAPTSSLLGMLWIIWFSIFFSINKLPGGYARLALTLFENQQSTYQQWTLCVVGFDHKLDHNSRCEILGTPVADILRDEESLSVCFFIPIDSSCSTFEMSLKNDSRQLSVAEMYSLKSIFFHLAIREGNDHFEYRLRVWVGVIFDTIQCVC